MADPGGMDALMRAVALCDEEAALEAVDAGSGIGVPERETGYTALHYACQYGMDKLVSKLLDRGASLQARTKDLILQGAVVQPGGQTPLHLAACNGEDAVVDVLLARGCDPLAEDIDGLTPAVRAAMGNRRALAARLAEVIGIALPSQEELQSLAEKAKAQGQARAAERLEVPGHLRRAYTLEGMFSLEECADVLTAVHGAAASRAPPGAEVHDGWTTERHAAYATNDLPCKEVPAIDGAVRSMLRARVLPRLAARHGWLPAGTCIEEGRELCEADGSRLAFRDLFFVRYSAAAGGQRGLALHRDGSIISFNILLNSPADFDGGGTYIEADDHAYLIGQGDCFVHSGKLRHGGQPVARGERYVLVGFVDVLEEGEHLADFGM